MSNIVTVKRNWTKKIKAITENNPPITIYSLNNNFHGVTHQSEDLYSMIMKEIKTFHNIRLTYDKDNGNCCLHIHSNLWYNWTKKINW